MGYPIVMRRGTSSDWITKDSILRAGEIGVEIETGWFKVGDGVTHWNNLPYHMDEEGVTQLVTALIAASPTGAYAEQLIGDMDDLSTFHKDTVVEAINEVNTTMIPLTELYTNAKAG